MPGTSLEHDARPNRTAPRWGARVALVCLFATGTMGCFGAPNSAADNSGNSPTGPGVGFRPPAPPPTGAPTIAPPTEADTVSAAVHADQPQFPVASNFLGMSFEIWDMINNPRLADPVLVRFFQNLGPGVLRYGGTTADEHWWNPTTRGGRSDGAPVVTNADFQTLAAFSKAVGWPIIYTVNLANLKPDTAAAEVHALAGISGNSLLGVSIGNEPDHYVMLGWRSSGWGGSQLSAEWSSYADAIQARTSGIRFVGLDGCCVDALHWLPAFSASEASRLVLGAHHIYPEWNGAASGTNYYPSIPDLLSPTTTGRVIGDVTELYAAVAGHAPLRITESNSVASGGATGVSDVFAASLWGMEHLYTLAEHGAVGVNFHGSLSGGVYQPLDGNPGRYTARPLYYAMLAFHTAAQGSTVPVTVSAHYNVTVHATVAADGSLRVTAINRESAHDVQVQINSGRTYTHAGTLRLTGPSLSANSGITFAGSGVSSSGTWTPGAQEPVYSKNGVYAVSLPAASAAVITLVP